MNFTDKDKMLARKYREAGYNWAIRDLNSLYITQTEPMKFITKKGEIIVMFFLRDYVNKKYKRIDKRNFKPIQPDSEPTALSDIINP